MKKGWEVGPLGDLLDIQNGYAFSSKQFSTSDGVPLIRIRDLKNGISTETRYVGDFDDAYVVNSGDLLIGMDGEFGCFEWRGPPALLNQRVCRLQAFDSKLVPRFLFYGINKYLKEIEDVTTFTTVKHLSSKQIKAIEFPLPPPPEQKRIVEVLDKAFEGLAVAKANAEANLQNAQELFGSALHQAFYDESGTWEELTLGEIGTIVTGATPKTSEAGHNGSFVPFIKPGDFKPDGTLEYRNQGLSKKGASVSRLVKPGSAVMVCIGATIGKAAFTETQIATNQQINAITSHSGVSGEYLYYQMLTPEFQSAVIHSSGQATLPIINKSKWSRLKMRLPLPRNRQTDIVDRLRLFRAELGKITALYETQLKDIDDLRQSLLQKAFVGELA